MEAMKEFTGEIKQFPPVYSAVKVGGKRAYKQARKGQEIELRPRFVEVNEFEILEFAGPDKVKVRIACSKGTYIRSLIHDLGQALGVGAYISELCRTRIGEYHLENAWEISDFGDRISEMREQDREPRS